MLLFIAVLCYNFFATTSSSSFPYYYVCRLPPWKKQKFISDADLSPHSNFPFISLKWLHNIQSKQDFYSW